MSEVLTLIKRRNLCYNSFLKTCEDFLQNILFICEQQKLIHDPSVMDNSFDQLELFKQKRHGLIQVIEKTDYELHLLNTHLDLSTYNQEKDRFIQNILNVDSQIFTILEKLKEETIQKLIALQANKKSLTGYKSPLQNLENSESVRFIDKEI